MPTIIGNIKKLIRSNLNKSKNRKRGDSNVAEQRSELNAVFRFKYTLFKELLAANSELLTILSDMEEKLKGNHIFGSLYIKSQANRALMHTFKMVKNLNVLSGGRYIALYDILDKLNQQITSIINEKQEIKLKVNVIQYSHILKKDADWVGGKSANIGEIKNRLNIPVPEGFAITTRAFDSFLEKNNLKEEILQRKNMIDTDGMNQQGDLNNLELLNRLSSEVIELIKSKPVPEDIIADIKSASKSLWGEDSKNIRVAMRSSAIGEDGELSFAGQYLTILNVHPNKIAEAYKSIIASLYSARSISYRISKGIYDYNLAMAVACIKMVDSVASGVMYTRHPYNIVDDNILINAVWGLGPYAVDGIIVPDSYIVEKGGVRAIKSRYISKKEVQLICNNDSDGGVIETSVPIEKQLSPCLSDDQIEQLALYGEQLEKYYNCAKDIEWAVDNSGKIIILQSRPLKINVASKNGVIRKAPPISGYQLLIDDSEVASQGVGSGRAFHVLSESDLLSFPKDAILVAHHSSPEYVVVMKKCSAIITESGSVSGHMAALAREFNVPTLMGLGAQDALNLIPNGMEITVDAYTGRVYKGVVKELLLAVEKKEAHMKETAVYEHLKIVAELMTPLYLINPKAPEFIPSGCRTLHDIARFCHEFSYIEMFSVSDIVSKRHGCSFKLKASLPIDLHIIDLGNGLSYQNSDNSQADNSCNNNICVEDILSIPFIALLKGMLNKEVNSMEPRPVNFSGLFSVMQQQIISPGNAGGERFGDRSYAIIADKYLNFSSRVGYHYSVVDAYCGETINKNYITFSFKGGAADDIRRNRRVRSIALILKEIGFNVDVKEDKVDARLQKYPASFIQNRLDILGRLLIFTRQMDMLMTTENSVTWVADNFIAGNYKLSI